MFKAAVACSQEKDTKKAASQVLSQAFESLGEDRADLAFVFSSFSAFDHPLLLKTLTESGKISQLVGGTTSGEICGSEPLNGSVTVMLLSSKDVRMVPVSGEVSLTSPVEDAKKFAEKLRLGQNGRPKLIILLGTGGKGTPFPGDAALVGFQSVFGEDITIVGGGSGDELTFTQPILYFNDQTLIENKAAAVAFYGDVRFGIGVRHGWQGIGRKFKITQAEGYLLKELEGKTPRDIFIDRLGEKVVEKLNDPQSGIPMIYPLGIEIEGADELLIRTPVLLKPDGSVIIGGVGKVGQDVRLAIGSREKILAATEEAASQARDGLAGRKPAAVLFFDCICRKLVMGAEVGQEPAVVTKYFPGVPTAGFYTYGEFAPLRGQMKKTFYHNQSAVLLALA